MRAVHTSMPTEAATFTMSTSLVRVLVPHFWSYETPISHPILYYLILSQYAKDIMKTHVSSEQITTAMSCAKLP